ncbi:hypothetical protein FOA52_015486 [Chlamydomonas sp. UWO 241]|nr:hypothetical protein FOA52_015486 [Chlamydomonas sp. UWO 241]
MVRNTRTVDHACLVAYAAAAPARASLVLGQFRAALACGAYDGGGAWRGVLCRALFPDAPPSVTRGLRGLEVAVPALWRVPLLNARKEPIWRLWVCAGLRTLEAAVPGLWRLPLLSACKEPIWRLWVWLLQPPAGVRAGVWAVVAALVVDAMERGCRHLWRITRPRDGVLPPDRTVSVERAGALATMDLWNALASFAEGGVMPREATRLTSDSLVSTHSNDNGHASDDGLPSFPRATLHDFGVVDNKGTTGSYVSFSGDITPEQRRAKNRVAQRRFRERQKGALSEMQAEIEVRDEALRESVAQVHMLKQHNSLMAARLAVYEGMYGPCPPSSCVS